jgi:hypothetical protein
VRRYVFIMLVFQLSGLIHIIGDIAAGVPVRESGVMQWFSIQALGFLLEDSVVATWYKLTGVRVNERKLWQRVIGFVWVVGWMVWTMPVWTYPIARESKGEGILPFSMVRGLLAKR